jgi:hypothetical protein
MPEFLIVDMHTHIDPHEELEAMVGHDMKIIPITLGLEEED